MAESVELPTYRVGVPVAAAFDAPAVRAALAEIHVERFPDQPLASGTEAICDVPPGPCPCIWR